MNRQTWSENSTQGVISNRLEELVFEHGIPKMSKQRPSSE